jgi:hypothetical protein
VGVQSARSTCGEVSYASRLGCCDMFCRLGCCCFAVSRDLCVQCLLSGNVRTGCRASRDREAFAC